ncbi:MAG: universal stress protein [Hyphomicrobiaceae bacterium]
MRKILCAYDGSEHGKLAVREASQMAKTGDAKLTLIVVNTALGTPRAPAMYQWEAEEADRIAEEARAIAIGAGASRPEIVVVRARDPAGAVIHYAHEQGFDHIVTGTGEKGAVAKLVLGSVSHAIVSKAHCSVTVAR